MTESTSATMVSGRSLARGRLGDAGRPGPTGSGEEEAGAAGDARAKLGRGCGSSSSRDERPVAGDLRRSSVPRLAGRRTGRRRPALVQEQQREMVRGGAPEKKGEGREETTTCWWCPTAKGAPGNQGAAAGDRARSIWKPWGGAAGMGGSRERRWLARWGKRGRRLVARGFGHWMAAAIWLGGDGSGGIPRWKRTGDGGG